MISSLSSDTSEEARSKIQKWQFELTEAEENLAETEQDHYLSEQQKMLDRLYQSVETYFDDKMDNRDMLLEELSRKVKDNKDTIKSTLEIEGDELGTGITSTMKNLWKDNEDWHSIEEAITQRDGRLQELKDSVNGEVNSVTTYLSTSNGTLGNIYTEICKICEALGVETTPTNKSTTEDKGGNKKTSTAGDLTGGSGKTFMGFDADDFTGGIPHNGIAETEKGFEQVREAYNNMVGKKGALKDLYGAFVGSKEQYEAMYRYLKNRNLYASGAKRIRRGELAWTQENGLEAIIRQSDGAILTPLARNDSVLSAAATQNIWDMANDPLQFIKDNSVIPNLPTTINGGDYDIQQSMVITLPNVMNYPEFVSQLQKDKKFEQMMQDMTINKLTGGSQLAKYKYKY